ncbi:MAG: regulatory iron-sulfur-containing complex subunit RicT [Planctomycetota bacterium]
MPGSIVPLPVMLEEEDRKIYEALEPPKTIVVRYGYQRKIAELPYSGDAKPGCGSKLVAVTPRGTEVVEMLTTTCGNSGCGKSVSREEMRDYIEKSGGKQFPFTNQGRVLRVATVDDLNENARFENRRADMVRLCKALINELKLEMKLVEVESILGDEQISFYYLAENRVDFRELVRRLASELHTRIEMVHVSDREEARLVADYEKCGQHCCCRQFLKVLKPVSMRAAKVQKNTLDPQKISGRCGRLMCCLRYEDETYSDLKKKLPHRKSLVETIDGVGIVLSTQILTQLALVKVGAQPPAAYAVEDLRVLDKDEVKAWREEHGDPVDLAKNSGRPRGDNQRKGGPRGKDSGVGGDRGGQRGERSGQRGDRTKPRRPKPGKPLTEGEVESKEGDSSATLPSKGYGNNASDQGGAQASGDQSKKKRRRRRRRKGKGGQGGGGDQGPPPSGD